MRPKSVCLVVGSFERWRNLREPARERFNILSENLTGLVCRSRLYEENMHGSRSSIFGRTASGKRFASNGMPCDSGCVVVVQTTSLVGGRWDA